LGLPHRLRRTRAAALTLRAHSARRPAQLAHLDLGICKANDTFMTVWRTAAEFPRDSQVSTCVDACQFRADLDFVIDQSIDD
jgi:hypothetical protein